MLREDLTVAEERKTKIIISKEKKISSKLPIFYNPKMKHNRDFSVMIISSMIKSIKKEKVLKIALPMCATGIRGLRIAKEIFSETEKNIPETEIYLNDKNKKFNEIIKQEIDLNNLANTKNPKIIFSEKDANKFMSDHRFDYIDIDPFGSPNPFLDTALRSIKPKGILAATATDTSDLCGTYPLACKRKYWSEPLRNYLMKEIGLRILIRKIQLLGFQYELALKPILSYSKDHYMKCFFYIDKKKKKCDDLIKQHSEISYNPKTMELKQKKITEKEEITAGPIWTGRIIEKSTIDFIEQYAKDNYKKDKALIKFISLLKQDQESYDILKEKGSTNLAFYDTSIVCEKYKMIMPSLENLTKALTEKGFIAKRTHFNFSAIRGDFSLSELKKTITKLNN